MELKMNVDLRMFEKLFDYELKDYTNQQKSDIYDAIVEMCLEDRDVSYISDIIRFDLVRQKHDEVLSDYPNVKEYMEDQDITLLEALNDYTRVYSYDDDEVVYVPF